MPDNYLVLHIDMEFIVGTISTGYGTPHPILVDDSPLMWLYFFNDPNCHKVTFGKGYKKHFMDREYNYYGKFLKSIENDCQQFTLRHAQYPLVELLDASGMLSLWKKEYANVTYSTPNEIPTLLSFSSSISDLSKQKFVDFVGRKGFKVFSYTIPLSELAFFKLYEENRINVSAGHSALMLEATNATLHFTKLTYVDNYFLKDGITKYIVGKGIDPRKRAICKFVVGELNSMTGILSSDEEREEEIERFELSSGEWLHRLDMSATNRPLQIKKMSFARAPHIGRDILVKKENLESDTGRYLEDLVSEYEAFISEYCPSGIDFCCFIGNCFLSDRIRSRFESLIGRDNIFFYKTTDVSEIISRYPRIDLKRYADEENRIRERANIDALKQEQERQTELLRKQKEKDAKAIEEAERLRKQHLQLANEAYQQALDLDKKGQLQDAKIAIDKAINLSPENIDYRKWADYLSEKIKTVRDKITLYKQYLSAGDGYFEEENYSKAIEEYKKAKDVDDNAEINSKIIECQDRVRRKEEQKQITLLNHLKSELQNAERSQDYKKAIELCGKLMEEDTNNLYKWENKQQQLTSSCEQAKKHREKIAKLRRDINGAVFNENWDKVIQLCDKVPSLADEIEILEIRNKAQNKIEAGKRKQEIEKKRHNIEQKLQKIKSLIEDGKLELATQQLNSIEKNYPEIADDVKTLRKEIFNKEDNILQPKKQSNKNSNKRRTNEESPENTDDFFNSNSVRKEKNTKEKSSVTPTKTEDDFFDTEDVSPVKNKKKKAKEITNDDFDF